MEAVTEAIAASAAAAPPTTVPEMVKVLEASGGGETATAASKAAAAAAATPVVATKPAEKIIVDAVKAVKEVKDKEATAEPDAAAAAAAEILVDKAPNVGTYAAGNNQYHFDTTTLSEWEMVDRYSRSDEAVKNNPPAPTITYTKMHADG